MNIKMNFQANVSYEKREAILKNAAAQSCGVDVDQIENHITQLRVGITRGSIYFNLPEEVPEEKEEESPDPEETAAPSPPPTSNKKVKAKKPAKPKAPKK